MSRILLTWELGLNLGHLTRLLPVAQRLKEEGHTVLVASRDLQAAARVLGPAGIPFVQAPHLPNGIALPHRATGYADILLSQGWSDPSALWGLTQGWLNLFAMFKPDQMILDYSPTVMLAAKIAKIQSLLVGNGFEIPPMTDPLPPFPGFTWATPEKAAQSEKLAIEAANTVLKPLGGIPIVALRDFLTEHQQLFCTFPELDHYGERPDAQYIGPLLGHLNFPKVDWPKGGGPKIFACIRSDTNQVKEILQALTAINARVVCVASGFTAQQLAGHSTGNVVFSLGPVDLEPLLDADVCLSYGAEGTMMRFLMAGVPQLISPWHVETFLAATRIETIGCGLALKTQAIAQSVTSDIERLINDSDVCAHLGSFVARNTGSLGQRSLEVIVDQVTKASPTSRRAHSPRTSDSRENSTTLNESPSFRVESDIRRVELLTSPISN